jgi:hypothetical protein
MKTSEFLCIPMENSNSESRRNALLAELQKMKRLGFFVVDEAFDVVASMNAAEIEESSVSEVAFIVKERGFLQYKSKTEIPLDER